MKSIAVVGWGSLLWNPGSLHLDTGRWHKDGPVLPIEFARRSRNGTHLTLAIAPNRGTPVRTYWAMSGDRAIAPARENLRLREGTDALENVFVIDKNGAYLGRERDIAQRNDILAWLKQSSGIDAVIWTGLRANWPSDEELTVSSVAHYIRQQSLIARATIRNYIRRAPAQIRTPIRTGVEELFTLSRVSLPAECFEDGKSEA